MPSNRPARKFESEHRNPLTDFETIAVDEAGNWHAVQQ
jgi:hypothetical protein